MLDGKVTKNPDYIEICLIEERVEGYTNVERKLRIPLKGGIEKISGHRGKIERICQSSFCGFTSVEIGYEYEGHPLGDGTTRTVYLIWVDEREEGGEWLAITCNEDSQFSKRWKDVYYSGPYSLDDFYETQLIKARGINKDSSL